MAEKKNQSQDNLRYYELLRKVPQEATKKINGGRLSGMTDINPMFRNKIMTEVFGPCGIGWKYEIVKQWQETYGQEVKAFTNINLYVKVDGAWSDPIPGTGGATIVEINSKGYSYVNDEGFKMSLTDALSVSMKALGVAADIYYSKDVTKQQYDTRYEQQSYVAQQNAPTASNADPFNALVQGEIASCVTTEGLLVIWNKYPSLQQDARFSGAITARKDQIMNNGKS